MNPIIITEYDVATRKYIAHSCIAFREDEEPDREGCIKTLIKRAGNNSPLPQLLNIKLDAPPNAAPLYVDTDLNKLEVEYVNGEYLVHTIKERKLIFKSTQWPSIRGFIVGRVMVDYYLNKEIKKYR